MFTKVQNFKNTEERIILSHLTFLQCQKCLFGDIEVVFKHCVCDIRNLSWTILLSSIEIIEISRSFWSAPTLGALEESFINTICVPSTKSEKLVNWNITPVMKFDSVTVHYCCVDHWTSTDEIWIAWFRNWNWMTSLERHQSIWIFL